MKSPMEGSGGGPLLDDSEARRIAVDPRESVILQAPAGSGKTSLLVRRYLALLGHVERPEQILAITFTRKAAGEMRQRVSRELAGRTADAAAAVERDANFGWQLLDQPQRIKIQTIDAFALSLARRMPAASRFGFDANFVEDAEAVYATAVDRLFERLRDDPAAPLLADFLALIDNDYYEARALLTAMLARRDQWLDPIVAVAQHAQHPEIVAASVERAIRALNRASIARIADAVPAQLIDTLAESVVIAADQSDRPQPGPLEPDNIVAWRAAAQLATTDRGSARRLLTVRDGFPPRARAEKARAMEVIKALDAHGATPYFAAIRAAPDSALPDAEREAITCFAVALSLLKVELDAVFRDLGAVDFPELIINARRALEREGAPTDLALAMDYRIAHILVDEFQDTSLGQYRLLQTLMESWHQGDSNSFFAVGDPMQSVYRFRDADVRLYQETFSRGIGQVHLRGLQLTSNFRSRSSLVDWCNTTFGALFGADSIDQVGYQPSVPVTQAGGEVRAVVCLEDATGRRQSTQVVKRILEIRREHPEDSHRRAGTGANCARGDCCQRCAAPTFRGRGKDIELLADTGVVRDLHALTLALADANNRFAWLCVLRSPLIGMPLLDLERAARARGIDDMLHVVNYSQDGKQRIARLAQALARQPAGGSARRRVEWLWLRLGGVDAYDDDTHPDDAARYLDLLEALEPPDSAPGALWSAVCRLYASSSAEGQAVEVMTIHKAKGLEFDHVIVPGLEKATRRSDPALVLWRPEGDDLLMATATSRENGSLYRWLVREERIRDRNELGRLIYVAATRAIKSLTWFASFDRGVDSPPPRESMLSMIWPLIREQAVFVQAAPDVDPDTPRQGNVFNSLPGDYVWTPPVALPEMTQNPVPQRDATASTLILDQPETAIGNIVHGELKRLAATPLPDSRAHLAAREAAWDRLLRHEGIGTASVLAEIRRQIANVLDDEYGRWLLDPTRRDAESEVPYTALIDGEIRNVVIDRTFVDDGGCRWIVDYKTAVPRDGQDKAEFAQLQRDRHAAQLALYARVLSQLDDSRPIKTALYLTALPKLVEVETREINA